MVLLDSLFFFLCWFHHQRCIVEDLARARSIGNVPWKNELPFLFDELIKLCKSQWFTKLLLESVFLTIANFQSIIVNFNLRTSVLNALYSFFGFREIQILLYPYLQAFYKKNFDFTVRITENIKPSDGFQCKCLAYIRAMPFNT